ncbi:MAG: AMP-binding protein, partial [Proteobacteria bacterium]|nr:AMP-binding protein [Pseudomonadota bacterium]
IYELFNLRPGDSLLGVLPFFHSFGFTATLWLPLLCSMKAVYHHNPFDAAKVGELISTEKVKVFMSTPTFLLAYIRKCRKEQFRTLEYVITGAEKLKDRIAQAFFDKFGIFPMEGYGCTELSPVAALNVPNYIDSVMTQVGHKPGTVGHPIPGVAARIVDIDTLSLLPPDVEGLLQIKGPNVMLGYLNNKEKTDEVIVDGWYNTGDIAKIDEDGFITITDRLSRFSKIAGEMVPHQKIEEAIHSALGESETICAVSAVEDESRGEKLVVLITKEVVVGDLNKKLQEGGMPNLWIPKAENYFMVEGLPLLGTGKLDLKEIKRKAKELSGS